jgi:hypothetical protein
MILLPMLFIMACPNPAEDNYGDGNDELTGIDAEDFGASASISGSFNVGGKADWDNAIAAIRTGGKDKNYVINLTNNVTIPSAVTSDGRSAYNFGSVTGITVSLRGQKTLTLDPDGPKGSLLSVRDGQTLVLRESALVGRKDNDEALVSVSGKFTMYGGKISGNTVSSENPSGGGVDVDLGIFIMRGGEIYDNSAPYGGGALVYRSVFTMSGGEIHDNSTPSGGGVLVYEGIFAMSGGRIFGNSALQGGGVYVSKGSRLNKTGGVIYGSDAAADSFKNTATDTFTNEGGETVSTGNALTFLTTEGDSTIAWHINYTLSDTTDGNIDTANPERSVAVPRRIGVVPEQNVVVPKQNFEILRRNLEVL